MRARLLILLGAAGVLSVFAAVQISKPADKAAVDDSQETLSDIDQARLDEMKKSLASRPLPGEDPPEKAEFQVQVEVNRTSGKNRLDIWISETHGYYAETLVVEFWYKKTPDMSAEDSPFVLPQHFEAFVRANETLKTCMELVPAELSHVGGTIGTSENWGARVIHYGRAREHDPDHLPLLTPSDRCDE